MGVSEVAIVRAVVAWWDAVELWVTQLAFPVQVLLVVLVVLPLCGSAAVILDRGVDRVVAAAHRGRGHGRGQDGGGTPADSDR